MRELARRPRLLSDPVHYAIRLGYNVLDRADGPDADVIGTTIFYRWHPDPRVRGLRVAWALAQALLRMWGYPHNDADVCRTVGALLLPQVLAARLRTLDVALRLQPHAPDWLLAARLPSHS